MTSNWKFITNFSTDPIQPQGQKIRKPVRKTNGAFLTGTIPRKEKKFVELKTLREFRLIKKIMEYSYWIFVFW